MNNINELKSHTLPSSSRIKQAESWIIRLKDSDLEDPDDYDLYNNALSIIIEAIESGKYHIKRRYERNASM